MREENLAFLDTQCKVLSPCGSPEVSRAAFIYWATGRRSRLAGGSPWLARDIAQTEPSLLCCFSKQEQAGGVIHQDSARQADAPHQVSGDRLFKS